MTNRTCDKPTKKYPEGRRGTDAGHYAHRTKKDPDCEDCRIAWNEAQARYREENKEKFSGYNRKHRESRTPEQKEADKKYSQEYYQKNSEALKKKARDWRRDNLEQALESSRRYRKENPEKVRALTDRWIEENKDRYREGQRRYREEHRDEMREYLRQYYLDHPEKFEGYGRRRRALLRSLPSDGYTEEQVSETHGTICQLCNTEVDTELAWGRDDSPCIDHVHALAREGSPGDVIDNVRWAHALCNIKKHDLPMEDLSLPFEAPGSREWGMVD